MPFSTEEIKHLPEVISAPRFARYLQAKANHRENALELYEWNLEISSAFLVPLQICEVGVRNGVVEAIERVHGGNWPWSNGFIRSLPVPKNAWHYNPQDDLRKIAARMPTTGKVVAELKFAFWEKIFTKGQDARLWTPHLHSVFPGISASTPASIARANAFSALHTIRELRNRIAHHEPIFNRTLAAEYSLLRDVIYWRNPTAAAWLDRIERVTQLLAAKP